MKQRILLISVGVCIGMVFAELFVRCLGIAPEIAPIEVSLPWGRFMAISDPILKYVPRPNSSDINKLGLRWSEVTPGKSKSIKRILILGDSAGFGYCTSRKILPIEDTFAGLLNSTLVGSKLDYLKNNEVVNLSVSGYDTLQEVHFLKRVGLDLQPDIIIVLFHPNDFIGENASEELYQLNNHPWFKYRNQIFLPLLVHSELIRYLFGVYKNSDSSLHSSQGGIQQLDRTPQAFTTLADLGARYKFQTIILPYPYRGYIQPEKFSTFCPQIMPWKELTERLRTSVAAYPFKVRDSMPLFNNAFSEEGEAMYSSECDCLHPSRRENELLVDSILPLLMEILEPAKIES